MAMPKPNRTKLSSHRKVTKAKNFVNAQMQQRLQHAVAYHQRGQLKAAKALYEEILQVQPNCADALHLLGVIAAQVRQAHVAIDLIGQSIQINPINATYHNSLGNALRDLKRSEEALASFDRAIALHPKFAQAFSNRGNALQDLKRLEEALASYDRAIVLQPENAETHNNRGVLLKDLKGLEEALTSFDRAIALQPKYAEAYSNRGNALRDLMRLDEALANYDRAIALRPDYAEGYFNRGNALQDLKRLEEALTSYDHAIALQPDYAEAYLHKSYALLSFGNFEKGWKLHEWRWLKGERTAKRQLATDWDGQTKSDSLLVLPEQGVGDEIFYSSMLLDALPFTNTLTVPVDARLVALFERSFGPYGVRIVDRNSEISPHQHQIYMGSLGQHFRASVESFESARSPYLKACSDRRAMLRSQLTGSGNLICGLSWVSKNEKVGEKKSLSLNDLTPVLSDPGVQFVNLQYGDTSEEQAWLQKTAGVSLTNVDSVDNFKDLDGLAALIDVCDVVITVSNTTAHLAGALGKPVFVMLPYSSGLFWYWHQNRSDSPWYPTAKLFRQKTSGDWCGAIDDLKRALQQLMQS